MGFCSEIDWERVFQHAETVGLLWKKRRPIDIEGIAKELNKAPSDVAKIVNWLVEERILHENGPRSVMRYSVDKQCSRAINLFALSECAKERSEGESIKKFMQILRRYSVKLELKEMVHLLSAR